MTETTSPSDACETGLEPSRGAELHPDLDYWRANVGAPAVHDAGPFAAERLEGIDLICWNMAIGLGRIPELLERLRTGVLPHAGERTERPLVLLAQEVFRTGDLPGLAHGIYSGTAVRAAARTDILEFARSHGMSLRYSPSMRNGTDPSDRGNAVLASVRLTAARALLLPYVRQRRVAVSARIAGHPDLTFVSAHLDTHGRLRSAGASRRPGGGRTAQAATLGNYLHTLPGSVVLGADLNSVLGMADPAVRTLVSSGLHPARRTGRWRHTFHARLRLLLDHVLYRSSGGRIAGIEVVRIDEAAGDRSRAVFGSDHHPLLARIELGSD